MVNAPETTFAPSGEPAALTSSESTGRQTTVSINFPPR
jgi:hypothetical protein